MYIVYLSLCSIKAKYKTMIGVSRVRRSNRATHSKDYDLKTKIQVEEKLASEKLTTGKSTESRYET